MTPDGMYEVQVDISTWSRERGPRMQITGRDGGFSLEPSAQTAAAKVMPRTGGLHHRSQWIAGAQRVVLIEGVHDAERAYHVLVDTIRAEMVWNRLVRERRERAARYLREARAAYDGLNPREQFEFGHAQLMGAADRVARWEHVRLSDIAAAAQLTERDVEGVQNYLDELPREDFDGRPTSYITPLYLDIPAVAERIGVEDATVRSYKTRGMLPVPGLEVSGRSAWEWDVIERWIVQRRGQDWAAGTTADEAGRR
ncbi:helix-turn-helix transcriptional regulator [Nocardia wallacei]|uniref:helix-turn-helix transcriptional regulator n=1 Tax=Nocardia wallacei TaxID=480035 RepID=UPI0024574AF6|nr:hypothetical protein [Nocardia wallacei]